MRRLKKIIENLYLKASEEDYDALIPVTGDEGTGKSTLMLQIMAYWRDLADKNNGSREDNVNQVLDKICWTRDKTINALSNYEKESVILVPDASRILHKKEAMKSKNISIEKSLFDVRLKNFLILLGYQSWNIIPTDLQNRRAKLLIHLPNRGQIWIQGRKAIDTKIDKGHWPKPKITDKFRSLEGTELWREYSKKDEAMKMENIQNQSKKKTKEEKKEEKQELKKRHKQWKQQRNTLIEKLYEKGLTQQEIAQELDISNRNVSRIINYGEKVKT